MSSGSSCDFLVPPNKAVIYSVLGWGYSRRCDQVCWLCVTYSAVSCHATAGQPGVSRFQHVLPGIKYCDCNIPRLSAPNLNLHQPANVYHWLAIMTDSRKRFYTLCVIWRKLQEHTTSNPVNNKTVERIRNGAMSLSASGEVLLPNLSSSATIYPLVPYLLAYVNRLSFFGFLWF